MNMNKFSLHIYLHYVTLCNKFLSYIRNIIMITMLRIYDKNLTIACLKLINRFLTAFFWKSCGILIFLPLSWKSVESWKAE